MKVVSILLENMFFKNLNEKMEFPLLQRFYRLLICCQTRDLKSPFQVSKHSKKVEPKTCVYFWENGILPPSLPRSLVSQKRLCPLYFGPKFNGFSQPGMLPGTAPPHCQVPGACGGCQPAQGSSVSLSPFQHHFFFSCYLQKTMWFPCLQNRSNACSDCFPGLP